LGSPFRAIEILFEKKEKRGITSLETKSLKHRCKGARGKESQGDIQAKKNS
jgi:hypothetical protein